MASLQRSIKRSMIFRDMNKLQRKLWRADHGGKGDPKLESYRQIAAKLRKDKTT